MTTKAASLMGVDQIRRWYGLIKSAVVAFFCQPASARPLAALRIGLGSTLMVQAWLCRNDLGHLFSADGYVQSALNRYFTAPGVPTISWVMPLFKSFGLGEAAAIQLFAGLYFAALALMTFGLMTRAATVMAWFCHWVMMNTASATNYGIDLYAHVFLYYLMFSPAAGAWSLDACWGRVSTLPSAAARLALRVMQLHLCITYLTSAIEKASGEQWRNGELLWQALQLPVYKQFDMSWLINYPMLTLGAGWMTLIFEGCYFIFIWPRQTRRFWVVGIAGLHLGIVLLLGLGVFGSLMTILTLSLFGVSSAAKSTRVLEVNDARGFGSVAEG